MKFTLKDYQGIAVAEVLDRLRKARKRWHEDGDKHAFSLTAELWTFERTLGAADPNWSLARVEPAAA